MSKKIVVAFDHAGFELKPTVLKIVRECGYEIIDVGAYSADSVDFPDHAYRGAQKILNGEAEKGIFVCGSGVGMCLAANKIKGIYASVCHDVYSAHQAVEHDNMNVLCLGSRVIGSELASELIRAYLGASFNNKPNQIRRMGKVFAIENGTYSMTDNAARLREIGQSVWYDHIQRKSLKTERLTNLILANDISGLTSNPVVYRKAFSETDDYTNGLCALAIAGKTADEILTMLSVEDIRAAADAFREVFILSKGQDGFVTLEVDPRLCEDADALVCEAKKLWTAVNRPNLMLKVPVACAGTEAIRKLTAAGINIDATLSFGMEQFEQSVEAYISGIEERITQGKTPDHVHSVLSINISKLDGKIDPMLPTDSPLRGETGIRFAQWAYNRRNEIFGGKRFETARSWNANPLRLLWTSVKPKDPAYPALKYVEALAAKDTIISVTNSTLEALLANLSVQPAIPAADQDISGFFTALKESGISFEDICTELQLESLKNYQEAYTSVLNDIQTKTEMIRRNMGALTQKLEENMQLMTQEATLQRMFAKDPTVWTNDTQAFAEIRNRLGWINTYTQTKENVPVYLKAREAIKAEGIKKILLLGMGGSSLAPEVMALIFDDIADIKLEIVDSTDPDQVLKTHAAHAPAETLYIVSSKSGSTAEVRAFLDFFYTRAKEVLGAKVGKHFAAITDPGTGLERTAQDLGFEYIFISDPSVGGRFSALTPFGVVPAVLMGLSPEKIFAKAAAMAANCAPSTPASENEGLALGNFIGSAAQLGMDKLTIVTDSKFASFGSWLEQLIAESSGKNGKGVVPVDLEPETDAASYQNDRIFVYVKLTGEKQSFIDSAAAAGHPVYTICLSDSYDLFAEFYRWEIAVSIVCALLSVNAFDQPNVQDSKTRTVAKVNEYHEKGVLDQQPYNWEKNGYKAFYGFDAPDMDRAETVEDLVRAFSAKAQPGTDYIAINAYLPRNNEAVCAKLNELREMILKETKCATTLGFGPRFQHSTGQLHKGGANNGLFIQIVADCAEDAEIPNEDLRFSVLERAQALGDFESLIANGRRAIRIDFGPFGAKASL